MLTTIFVGIISNYHRELLKEGPYDVDRAYFRVMRIQTIADEVATPLSHLPSGAVWDLIDCIRLGEQRKSPKSGPPPPFSGQAPELGHVSTAAGRQDRRDSPSDTPPVFTAWGTCIEESSLRYV